MESRRATKLFIVLNDRQVFSLCHSVLVLTRVRQGYRAVQVRRRRRRTGGGGCQVPTKPGERGGGREGEWKTGIRPPPLYTRQPRRGGAHVCVLSVRPPSPAFVCARGGECIRTTTTTRCRPWSGRRGGGRSLLQQLQVGSVGRSRWRSWFLTFFVLPVGGGAFPPPLYFSWEQDPSVAGRRPR